MTLFKAYQSALYHLGNAAMRRGTIQGIAVRDDEEALVWQRYNRLVYKLEKRLYAILEQVDEEEV